MGFSNAGKDIVEPTNIDFEVKRSETGEVTLEPFIDDNKNHRKVNTEYISKFQSFSWGTDHGLFVDNSNRVFSCGNGKFGKLGLGNEEDQRKPVLITDLQGKFVGDVQAGPYHSMAITKDGKLYTWGCGQFGRLG